MDAQLAGIVVSAGFRSSRELSELLHLLKTQCSSDEFDRLKGPIGDAIAEITKATLTPAFASHPALETEVEAQIAKYGRFA